VDLKRIADAASRYVYRSTIGLEENSNYSTDNIDFAASTTQETIPNHPAENVYFDVR
jgi:hypothetical protein